MVTDKTQRKEPSNQETEIFSALINHTDTQLAYLDVDFTFIYVNDAYLIGCGLKREELIGKNHFDLFPNDENKKLFTNVRESGRPVELYARPFEFIHMPEKGITYWDWTLSPVKNDQGLVQGLVLSLKEMTHRHKIKKVSGNSPYKLLAITTLSVFVAEFSIMGGLGLLTDSHSIFHAVLDSSLLTILIFPLIYFYLIRPLIYNISERRIAQEQLKTLNGNLEQAIQSRTEELARANDQLLSEIRIRHGVEQDLKKTLDESRQRESEITALLEGAKVVLDQQEFESIARSIFTFCKDLIGATGGYVALLTENGMENEVLFLDAGNQDCTVDPFLPMPIRGLREQVYHNQKAMYDNNFGDSDFYKMLPKGHVALENVMFAPLIIDQKVHGLLGLANKPGGFTENDMRMATAFGELAAIALSNGRTRDELKKSEERFRAVVQTASDAIINIDREGMITFWNEAATEIFGYDLNEIFGRSITCLLPERFRKAHTDGITRFLKTGQSKIIGTTVEMAALRRNGEEFPVGLSLSEWKLGEEIRFTGIIRDISIQKQMERDLRTSMDSLEDKVRERTAELSEINEILNQKIEERRKAEETLETERQRLFSVLDEIPASIHLLADDHTIRFANRYFRTQFGDYTQAPCYQIKQGNDTPCNSCRTFDVFRTGEPNELEDWYADGQLYQIYNYPFKDVDGSDLILQLGIDITKQKEAENDLRESEERFKVLVNSMNDTVFTLNNDKRIKEVYGRGLEKIGYQINEVIGKRINQIFGDIDNPIHLQAIKKVFAGNNDVYEWQIETSPYGKRYIQNSMAPIYDESGSIEGLVGVARDITLQKTLEQQLIQTEKLMAVAQMSAMIAHEFRNALTSLRMILELQMESVTITKSEKKALTVALDSVSHMEGIITELVDFSRPSPMTFSTVDISHLIEESILLIKPHCAKYKVNLEENLAENIPVLRADPIRLKETFVNILLNAVQALSSGNQDNRQKKVQIESEQLTVEKNLKNEPGNSGAPANGSAGSSNHMIKKGTACVRITVSDNGSGIAEKNLKHIFDPFFTTKIGGTGLGMHIVHRTVQAHGGIIRIKNLQPGGTKIAIYLPIKGHH